MGLFRQCMETLDENTYNIQAATGIKTTLNGLQGHVSAKKVASVAVIDTGLQRLYANLRNFYYKQANLLSCMTRCGKLPLHGACLAGKNVNGRILQIVWIGNER